MAAPIQPLFSESWLRATWGIAWEQFRGSGDESDLVARLERWASRPVAKETSSDAAFVQVFFKELWEYWAAGELGAESGHTCVPQFPVPGAGQTGGTGQADVALGWFGRQDVWPAPQVLCELKDVRSGLDQPQRRKGNDRSPVQQCGDYLRWASAGLFGHEPVKPTWGIVSDMNELRLYLHRLMPGRAQRFVIRPAPGDPAPSLLGDSDAASFHRFVFARMLHREQLLSKGGPSPLETLLERQWIQEKSLERGFYAEYHAYRKELVRALEQANPDFVATRPRGRLVRLAQRWLDRCLFVLYCEDMGPLLGFPKNVLRSVLQDASLDRDYDHDDTIIQQRVAKLFRAMASGGDFRDHRIQRFNGGLFEEDADLDELAIPSRIFCARGQGADELTVRSHPLTLLYFSATYNFGVQGPGSERVIDLYTLGRIFEQSITDLEIMEADADGRQSIHVSRRKRDGVWYTPEWVTAAIVEQTVGARLTALRGEVGLPPATSVTDDQAATHSAWVAKERARGGRRTGAPPLPHVFEYLRALDLYEQRVQKLRVVDPACGSGAFLIQSFERLLAERRFIATERRRLTGIEDALLDMDAVMKEVLAENIFGVDINSESVEITRLALWLRTALPNKPLSHLDRNIQVGNSLIGPELWATRPAELFGEDERDRIAVFDWREAFPAVFAAGGFDCVVGNPPYVKLQNFRKVEPVVAEHLTGARRADGGPLWESTQTGNFDLYLPFVELGLRLLRPDGWLGYIAPSTWAVNEYGEGLRRLVRRTRSLDRWIDFGSFQVFDESITYTAIQVFRGAATDGVRVALRPDGRLTGIEEAGEADVRWEDVPVSGPWALRPRAEARMLARLAERCFRLDDPGVTRQIFQGVITSADLVYHLVRVDDSRWRRRDYDDASAFGVERDLLRPLVSGTEAKRYCAPETSTSVIFPYDTSGARPRLWTAAEMETHFPLGWAYLKQYEQLLRDREGGAFDDDQWYRFGRSQNIDKQHLPKLGVAQTVPELRVFHDEHGAVCLNNVRVNGILTGGQDDAWFVLAVLNSPVATWVLRRTAKPKEGGYWEANKQFIAPLPVPRADSTAKETLAAHGKRLQELWTGRRDKMAAIDRRLMGKQTTLNVQPPNWLWADVGTPESWKRANPNLLSGRALSVWAKEYHASLVQGHADTLTRLLAPGPRFTVDCADGEVVLRVDGREAVTVYEQMSTAPFVAAQWRHALRGATAADRVDGERLARVLCTLRATENEALRDQVMALDREVSSVETEIARVEEETNRLLYRLYELTPDEIALVEADRTPPLP